jgi:hypothetical protein
MTQQKLAAAIQIVVADERLTLGIRELALLLHLTREGAPLMELARTAQIECRHNLTGRLHILRRKGLAKVVWRPDGKTMHALTGKGAALIAAMTTGGAQ